MTNEFEELRREIDYQIETYRQHQEIAQNLLRILLGIVGLILTAVSFGYSQGGSNITGIVSNQQLNRFSAQLQANYPISSQQADIVILLLVVAYLGIILSASYNLFGRASVYQLRVISPSVFDPDVPENYLSRTALDNQDPESYREIIRKNSEFLEKSQTNLDNSLKSIQTGVWSLLVASSGVIPPLFVENPFFIIIAAINNGIVIGVLIINRLNWQEIQQRIFIERRLDSSALLITLSLYALTQIDPGAEFLGAIALVILLIGLCAPLYHGIATATRDVELIIERQGLLFLMLLIFFLIFRFLSLGSPAFLLPLDVFGYLLVTALYATIGFGLGHVPRYTVLKIGNIVQRKAPSRVKRVAARSYKRIPEWFPLPNYPNLLETLDEKGGLDSDD